MRQRNQQEIGAYTPTPMPSLDGEWAAIVRRLGLGLLAAASVTVIGLAWVIYGRWPGLRFVAIGLLVGGFVVIVSTLAGALASLWGDLERVVGRDLDHSGAVGDGLVLLRARGGADADAQLSKAFSDFVAGCAVDTSARRWEPELGRQRYQQWRDQLISGGWARWRSDDQRAGWELAATPEEIAAALG